MIPLLRSVLAVVVGYIIFAVRGYAVFRLSGQAAHAAASMSFLLISVALGIVFAFAGGYVAGMIAGRRPLVHALTVAILIAIGAAVSLVATLSHGSVWSQVAALILIAPSAALGGRWRERRFAVPLTPV